MINNWRVTIDLLTPLAEKPPQLDSLLIWELANRRGFNHGVKLTKSNKLDEQTREIYNSLPLSKITISGVNVFRCSSPVYFTVFESVERQAKRFECDKMATLLAPQERRGLLVSSGPYKMRFSPIRTLLIPQIVYLFRGDKHEVRKILKSITAIGRLRNIGYGVVKNIIFDEVEEDQSVFAKDGDNRILMRPIPTVDDEDLIGCRKTFGACRPPYWHPDNYQEILEPC